MTLAENLKRNLRKTRLRFSLPFVSYEVDLGEIVDTRSVDERIAQLSKVKDDLQAAIAAVGDLQARAVESKSQHEELEKALRKLEEEKATTEALLKIPEESFSRVFAVECVKFCKKGIEGSVVWDLEKRFQGWGAGEGAQPLPRSRIGRRGGLGGGQPARRVRRLCVRGRVS